MNQTEGCRLELPIFEGPLDLLLHLIRKNDLDINDIPMALILDQYLQYLGLAHELNIDLAGEFLEMAAELTYIKSRMLLPEETLEEEEVPDPRSELVGKLLEYQKYKLAAGELLSRPLLGRDVFRRQAGSIPASPEPLLEADTLTLLSVFQGLLKRLPRETSQDFSQDRVGVSERVLELMEMLRGKASLLFEKLFEDDETRGELVVTLLAVLEMAKQRLIRVVQSGVFESIVVCPLFGGEERDYGTEINH